MEGSAYPSEDEELAVPPRASGTHSCSSLIRLEQEAKRKKRAQLQQHNLSSAMPAKYSSEDVLDLAEYTKKQPWWRKLFGPSSGTSEEKYSVATQLALGGVTGWCTGFIFQKIGKLAATAVGGGFFLLQIANHTGYIKIDWQMVERDVSKAKQQLKFTGSSTARLDQEVKGQMDEVATFLKKNVLLSGGFVGGFLLGMAS